MQAHGLIGGKAVHGGDEQLRRGARIGGGEGAFGVQAHEETGDRIGGRGDPVGSEMRRDLGKPRFRLGGNLQGNGDNLAKPVEQPYRQRKQRLARFGVRRPE